VPLCAPVMDVSAYRHSDAVTINRDAAGVYAIISDVTRIGELSPFCRSAAWEDPAQAGEEGAWFIGHNEMGPNAWDTHCKVVAAVAGREFTFINHGPAHELELVQWSYRLEPDGDATNVTESWQVLPAYPDFVTARDPTGDVKARIEVMAKAARDGIPQTLANLKRIAET